MPSVFFVSSSSFFLLLRTPQVVLCQDLHFRSQKRGHIPCLGQGYLLAECDAGRYSFQRRSHSLMHELWHIADFTEFGKGYDRADPDFTAQNPEGFTYSSQGAFAMRQAGKNGGSAWPEFLNEYSTASVAEDKAEVWAAMIWDPARLAANPALEHKAKVLRQRAARFCDEMNSEFWSAVEAYRRKKEGELGEAMHWEEWPSKEPGKTFWFNRKTGQRVWERPECVPAPTGG
jgi:hypothetical protein